MNKCHTSTKALEKCQSKTQTLAPAQECIVHEVTLESLPDPGQFYVNEWHGQYIEAWSTHLALIS